MRDVKIVEKSDGTVLVERFSPMRRVEHILVITTFTVLLLTGFPQKFEGAWAAALLRLFGGLDTARLIHRAAGIVFVSHAVFHIGSILVGMLSGRMRPTLLPVPQDLRDAWENLRYYFGFRPHPPPFPKFDYRQKFEYLGLVLGGLVMASTGLILMFPIQAANLLPGQVIPAAMVAHSNEAMLAFLVLAIWHVYGAHLSPEVFPMDTSVFTGFMTREELAHHHPLEYARLFGEMPEPWREEPAGTDAKSPSKADTSPAPGEPHPNP